jgi:hypothetical protein
VKAVAPKTFPVLNSMIPAMSWAVPPNAIASGITTGSPATGNRPALMLLKRTVVSPKPISPSGAGFAAAISAMSCLPALFVVAQA